VSVVDNPGEPVPPETVLRVGLATAREAAVGAASPHNTTTRWHGDPIPPESGDGPLGVEVSRRRPAHRRVLAA